MDPLNVLKKGVFPNTLIRLFFIIFMNHRTYIIYFVKHFIDDTQISSFSKINRISKFVIR